MVPERHSRRDTPPWYPRGTVGRHIPDYTPGRLGWVIYQVIHQGSYAGYGTPYYYPGIPTMLGMHTLPPWVYLLLRVREGQ